MPCDTQRQADGLAGGDVHGEGLAAEGGVQRALAVVIHGGAGHGRGAAVEINGDCAGNLNEMQAVRVKADLDRYLGLRTAHGADAPVNADVHRHTRVGREAAGIEKLVRLRSRRGRGSGRRSGRRRRGRRGSRGRRRGRRRAGAAGAAAVAGRTACVRRADDYLRLHRT